MEVILWMFIAAEGVATLTGFGLLFSRGKYLEQLRSLRQERAQVVLESSRKIVKVLRILFWFSPFYLILMPLVIYFMFGEKWFDFTVAIVALMYLMNIPLFISRNWLLRNFSKSGPVRDGM